MKLGTVKLEKDDIILFEVDPEILPLDTARKQFEQIYNTFSDHEVVAYLKGSGVHIVKEKDIIWHENIC